MLVCGNEPLNPKSQLAAVRNSFTDWDLWTCAEGTAIDSEGDVALLEGPKESPVGMFSIDVRSDILRSNRSEGEVLSCVFWIRWGDEGKIPAKL